MKSTCVTDTGPTTIQLTRTQKTPTDCARRTILLHSGVLEVVLHEDSQIQLTHNHHPSPPRKLRAPHELAVSPGWNHYVSSDFTSEALPTLRPGRRPRVERRLRQRTLRLESVPATCPITSFFGLVAGLCGAPWWVRIFEPKPSQGLIPSQQVLVSKGSFYWKIILAACRRLLIF